jgi:hypothetical protein
MQRRVVKTEVDYRKRLATVFQLLRSVSTIILYQPVLLNWVANGWQAVRAVFAMAFLHIGVFIRFSVALLLIALGVGVDLHTRALVTTKQARF